MKIILTGTFNFSYGANCRKLLVRPRPLVPNRVIREGWIESEAIASLDAHEERFFLRLCLKADDFGRYHANVRLMQSNLFPLMDDVRGTDITRWIAACEKAGLLRCYHTASGRFLEIVKFNQRLRIMKSKYPAPIEELKLDPGGNDRHTTDISQRHDGVNPNPNPNPNPNIPPKSDADPNPEHKAFIDGWCQNFRALHGFDYVFSGGKDAKAVKELLKMGILRLDLLEFAKQAWERNKTDSTAWNCKQASTIAGFRTYINQIRTELKNGSVNAKSNRNAGVINRPASQPTNAEVARRRQAQTLAGQVDSTAKPDESSANSVAGRKALDLFGGLRKAAE